MYVYVCTCVCWQNLAESNVELERKVEELKQEMREGQREIEATTDQYLKLRVGIALCGIGHHKPLLMAYLHY